MLFWTLNADSCLFAELLDYIRIHDIYGTYQALKGDRTAASQPEEDGQGHQEGNRNGHPPQRTQASHDSFPGSTERPEISEHKDTRTRQGQDQAYVAEAFLYININAIRHLDVSCSTSDALYLLQASAVVMITPSTSCDLLL